MVQIHKIPGNMKAFTQDFFKAQTYLGKTVIGHIHIGEFSGGLAFSNVNDKK